MAKYRSDIRTQVRSYLDEASSGDWTDTELNRLINIYYHKVRSAVITVYEDYYLTTDELNSVVLQQEYGSTDGLATDIFKIRRVEIKYSPSAIEPIPTRCLPIQNIDSVRRDLLYTNSSVGLHTTGNAFYYRYGYGSGLKIGFIPKPTESGTNAIKVWYVPLGSDLSDDTTALDIPNPDLNYLTIAFGATSEALRFGQQEMDSAKEFERKYERGIQLMQEELEDFVAEESKNIMDVNSEQFDVA